MAIRNDFTIDWNSSPRIITIAKPSVECTMQDLLDTLRWLESQLDAMDNPILVSASGKEPLGGGTKVGLTVSLQNAQVSFENRTITDGWTVCNLLGGNLVAFDTDGVTTIESVHPTAYVTISKTSSSSATLQEQDALNYSSYGGVVSIDETSTTSGVDYPSGTQEYPVNNNTDAIAIATTKGFHTLNIIGNNIFDTGDVIENYKIQGANTLSSIITVKDGAIVDNCEISNTTLTGVLDGGCVFKECNILELQFVSGIIYNCGLNEPTITLGGKAEAMFLDCYSLVSGTNTPTIDMNGTGQSLGIRHYVGGLRIKNRTGNDSCSIDINSGHLIIDSSCTGDPITVRGTLKLTVEAGATQPLIEGKALMVQDNVAQQVWNTQL